MKHYYLRLDTTVTKQNPGFGFCNSKKIIAFTSFALREKAHELISDFDYSCQTLTRKQAWKDTVSHELDYNGDRVIPVYDDLEPAKNRFFADPCGEIVTLKGNA